MSERAWALDVCTLVRVQQERSWLWLDLSVHCSVKYVIFFPPLFFLFFCVCLHTFQLGHKWLCPWPARIKAKTTPCPAATAARPPLEEQLNLWASGWTFFSSFQPFKHHLFAIQGSWSLSQQSLGESQDRTLNRLLAQHWKPGGSPHTLGGHILHRIKARTRLRVFIRLHLLLLFSQRQWWIVDGWLGWKQS